MSQNDISVTPNQQPSQQPLRKIVTATVTTVGHNDQVQIYKLPVTTATPMTTLTPNTPVGVISRDLQDQWFEIIYVNSLNEPRAGWIERANLQNLNLDGRTILASDLPIGEYITATSIDMANLIQAKSKMQGQGGTVLALVMIGIFGGMVLATGASPGLGLLFGVIFVCLGIGLSLTSTRDTIKWNVPLKEELAHLERIRRKKMSVGERTQEAAKKAADMAKAAAGLAIGVAVLKAMNDANNNTNRRR